MNFIKDYQPILMIGKIEFGLGQLGPILLGFEIEIVSLATDFQRERGFPRLARAE